MVPWKYLFTTSFYPHSLSNHAPMLFYALSLYVGAAVVYGLSRWGFRKHSPRHREVPLVRGSWPIVGHGYEFSRDPLGFIRKACRKYGRVFKIRLFRREMVVVCDKSLIHPYFRMKEEDMSLYDILVQLGFGDAFSDDASMFYTFIRIMQGTVGVKPDEFAPKILDGAQRMVRRMRERVGAGGADVIEEMVRFISSTSAMCFLAAELDEQTLALHRKFSGLLNKIISLSYFLPSRALRPIFVPRLSTYRKLITKRFLPEIQKYRADPQKSDSLLLRKAVDYGSDGKVLTDQDIGDLIVCLLYVSTENTAYGLSESLLDLARHPEVWHRVREESKVFTRIYQDISDAEHIFDSKLIKSCIMESARMNAHLFSIHRRPAKPLTLGSYYVGQVDSVALCTSMLMVHNQASDCIFQQALQYDPFRYHEPSRDKYSSTNVMTWGAGVHLCPGKQFALYEITAGIAMIAANFEELRVQHVGSPNYFSSSAFAWRPSRLAMIPTKIHTPTDLTSPAAEKTQV
ncbi:uncharacterized protein VTP21DRAFT_7119 [Calcarisporiella thermophila]|uniref:uncharacterized protein n=1 Tax=Calcarisporiella thermophila TaxID=911321 RepID=UPI003741F67E